MPNLESDIFFWPSYSHCHIWMAWVCTCAVNRNLTPVTPKWNPFMPRSFFFFFKCTHFFPPFHFFFLVETLVTIGMSQYAISWVQDKVQVFRISHYCLFLYNVTIVQGRIYHHSSVLNSLLLKFCCAQHWYFLKSWVLSSTLVHVSGFRASNLQIGLSSKDKVEFIIVGGNFKFTTGLSMKYLTAKEQRDLPITSAKDVWSTRTRKISVVTWPENAVFFFKKGALLLGWMFEESL